MLKKSLKILSITALLTIFACAKTDDSWKLYILSNSPEIQVLEKQDHKFCISLDLNSGSLNKSFSDDLYWHCRLSSAKYKLKTNTRLSQSLQFNAKVTELIRLISLRLPQAQESQFIKENKKIDQYHHERCLKLGYDFNIVDRLKTDEYLLCRKRLLDEDQLDPAFGVEEYLKYPNRSYNLSFVLNNRIDKETQRYEEARKNYPNCIKFINDDKNFKKCSNAQNQSKQCLEEINKKRFEKESEQKTICQKQAYVRFPDSFLYEINQKKEDIKQAKINADAYNQNNFIALGLSDEDLELFESEETANAKYDAKEKQRKLEKNINSKKGLYSKNELTKLRQKYIFSCQKSTENLLKEFVEDLKKDCEEIANYKEKDDLI